MKNNNKIAISGDLGSGKTTVSKLIADKLQMKRYSTGDIQRRLAAENNMTTLEFNKVSETQDYIDKLIDDTTAQMADLEEGIVFDSRMAWHFIPNSFSVRLVTNSFVGAERIMNAERGDVEAYCDIDEAIQKVRERKMSEKKRFSSKYGVDLSNLSNYNLVIDTSYASPEEVTSMILEKYAAWKLGDPFQKIWFNPHNLYPTHSIRDLNQDKLQEIQALMKLNGYLEDSVVEIMKYEENEFIIHGHHRVGAAIVNHIKFLPVKLLTENISERNAGETFESYVKNSCKLNLLNDWEEHFGFRFKSYPECAV